MSGTIPPPADRSDGGSEAGLDLADELELALAAVDAADAVTLPAFRARDFTTRWKANRTEVTEIDRGAERLIVDALVAARPAHGAFGEEHGQRGDDRSPWQWVVDPIDGTSGFVRGIPIWASLVALTHADHGAVLGVVSAPALGCRWWGGRGLGAHRSTGGASTPIGVSDVADLADAQVSVTPSEGWERLGLSDRLLQLQLRARRARGLGDFWQHVLVAEGAVDVAVDAVGVAEYDLAALYPIVEAAGGRFTDRLGVPTHRHDTAISSNGLLHAAVLELLAR
jgi:histidinol-phosphatase